MPEPDHTTPYDSGAQGATGPYVMAELDTDVPELGTVGRYRLLAEVGRGGMGAVYRGRDPDLDRELAVKVLLAKAEGPPDPELVERFLAEARVTGQLQHPGVPPVHEVGRLPDGRPFFAMKL